jgi:hypothetical protein
LLSRSYENTRGNCDCATPGSMLVSPAYYADPSTQSVCIAVFISCSGVSFGFRIVVLCIIKGHNLVYGTDVSIQPTWSRVLPQKLTGSQLVKKFSAFYRIRRFITAFPGARHLSLS